MALSPALKRWAKVGRPSGAGLFAPFSIYSSIISSLNTHPANFSDFILPVVAVSYGKNWENGGLTRIAENEPMERAS